MLRIYAFEETEYGRRPNRTTIGKGEVVELADDEAKKLAASHPDTLLLLAEGDLVPDQDNEYQTTVMIKPRTDRAMIPGRMSQQKKRQLETARGRSKNAHITLAKG